MEQKRPRERDLPKVTLLISGIPTTEFWIPES